MATIEESRATTQVDAAIQEMETLYRSMTGKDAPQPEPAYAPIPAEKDPAQHVDEQMNRLLSLLGQPDAGAAVPAWVPAMSVWESESEFVLCLDAPGVSREQIRVTLDGNRITVCGERVPAGVKDLNLRYTERPLGAFKRIVVLPPAVQGENPSAQLRDGVLEMRLRKDVARAASPRPVPVA
jgi:HSP20 family protein